MRVTVYHSYYGCDTGCCGHTVRVEDGNEITSSFVFDHPHMYNPTPEEVQEFIKETVIGEFSAEHCADIDWDSCIVSDD